MTSCNYINFSNAEIDRHIYRIIPLKRLYELFKNRENVLVRPLKWDDPFENFVLNSTFRLPGGETGKFGFNNDFYGQCWTRKAASDAMWRIYSPNSKGARIRTTVRKLGESLAATLGEWSQAQTFIGRVSYLSDKALVKFGKEIFADGLISTIPLAQTLLVKRKAAFEHEREVRLLYFSKDEKTVSDLFAYAVDPHKLVDQIMIDPRLPEDKIGDLKKEIGSETGFRGPILRSLLYAPPPGFVFPIG